MAVTLKASPLLAPPMRAAFYEEHGGPEVLRVGDLPAPALGPGDVRIQVKACALNHLDLWVRIGGRAFPLPLPHVGGTDLAGVITEVGSAVGDEATGAAELEHGVPGVGDEVIVNPGLNFLVGPDGAMVPPARPEIVGETRWGGLAQECVVPAANVLPRPAGLSGCANNAATS